MRENLTSIMNDLRVGQILRTTDGQEWVFVEPKKTRAVAINRKNGKQYLISGMVEVSEERDQEVVDRLEDEAVQEFLHERAVRKMEKGQCFIGTDDKEYIFIRFKKTKFICSNPETHNLYDAGPGFVKTILEKKIDIEN